MRWWCGPHEFGWGREFCAEYCDDGCVAEDESLCCAKAIEPLLENRFAWECFRDSFWQWSSSGMGDATMSAPYVQTMMADRGVTGHERDDQMQRVRVLAEELRAMNEIRSKRKRKGDQEG